MTRPRQNSESSSPSNNGDHYEILEDWTLTTPCPLVLYTDNTSLLTAMTKARMRGSIDPNGYHRQQQQQQYGNRFNTINAPPNGNMIGRNIGGSRHHNDDENAPHNKTSNYSRMRASQLASTKLKGLTYYNWVK